MYPTVWTQHMAGGLSLKSALEIISMLL